MEFHHVSVLLNECIDNLNIKPDGVYVDCTMGGAGHSKEIVKRLSDKGLFIGFDQDKNAIATAKERLSEFQNVKYVHDNHDNIKNILEDLQINGVDGILLDLGVSSYQLDERNRGFSYMGSGELDMRMDQTQLLTAKENQSRAVARAMEEYSTVLMERDQLKLRVIELEHQLGIKQNQTACNICNCGKGNTEYDN